MRWALLALLATFGFLTTAAGLTATPQSPTADFWMSGPPIQGGLVTARAPKNTRNVFLDDEALQLSSDGVFLMGFDRDAPVQANVVFILADGSQTVRNISVAGGDWRIENVAANMTSGSINSGTIVASSYITAGAYMLSSDAVYARSSYDTKIRSDSGGMYLEMGDIGNNNYLNFI